jgi:hypothetical protein
MLSEFTFFSKDIFKILTLILFAIFFINCGTKRQINPDLSNQMPNKILWAWERSEDLRFIDVNKVGVAFIAQHLYLKKDDVIFEPRRNPLEVPANTFLIAVTRIETKKDENRPKLSDEQKKKIVSLIKNTLELPNVKAIQIDFDVVSSERNFYKNLVFDLKKALPENTPLTITSLASWCVGDTWFNEFPIDEAVPMAFQMGADDKTIRDFLGKDNDWNEPLCRGSYGISIDEPLKINFKINRRIYYFNPKAWKATDLQKLDQ